MAKIPKIPVKQLSVWRLKDGVSVDDAIDSDVTNLIRANLDAVDGLEGFFAYRQIPSKKKPWLEFIKPLLLEKNLYLSGSNASGLLILSVDDITFCISYGYSRHWIDKEQIERRFGMKVTVNVADEHGVRSVDREELEADQRKTRTQAVRYSEIGSFGIDVQRDLLRSLTATPTNKQFAEQVTGSDNLVINARVQVTGIVDKLRECEAAYQKDDYKTKGYEWIDHFQRIVDPVKISELNADLLEAINGDHENVFLVPPVSLEFQDHIGFLYPRERKTSDKRPDLRTDEWLALAKDEDLSIDGLKALRIRHFTVNDENHTDAFRIYDAISFEVQSGNFLCILTGGEWFQVEQGHVAKVEADLMNVPLSPLVLPAALVGEYEGAYNIRASNESQGHLDLLDTKTVQYGGGYSKIEVCDLLSLDKEFIHVKVGTKSASLSHLFSQGYVSAQCFSDSRFRMSAKQKAAATHKSLFDGTPVSSDYEIVFAIVTKAAGDVRTVLPFFSKQSLVNTYEGLTALGYPVSVLKIPIE